MTERLIFLLAIHNHQPVGNFSSVFEKAFKECYLPFLKRARTHPALKLTLHFSGPLWEYMEVKERECWEIVQEMAGRRQIELLGGGFYEPILSIIPEEDRMGQLVMMNEFLEKNFGSKPRGIWLTERIWEPDLPQTLARAGIEYTLLDEEHFHYAGIKNIHAYYITEDAGFPLNIFPIDKKLRYLIPFEPIEEIQSYLDQVRQRKGMAILGDDGEKFGLWPGTHKWVYEEMWLEKFLALLEEENMQTLTYSEALDQFLPQGRIYLPPASYEEMMEWVLEPEDSKTYQMIKKQIPPEARRFLRGGFFREFFLKYPESNHLHKRMLFISRKVSQSRDPNAQRELYKGQGNDPYWHGIFGGLYLPHLREAAYLHLLAAEKLLPLDPGWQVLDYDLDGKTEVFYQGEKFNLIFKPSLGGSLVELDYRPACRNLCDVLSRRKETYHTSQDQNHKKGEGKSIHELTKEIPFQDGFLSSYDRYPRFSLFDHFLPVQTTQEEFQSLAYEEQGNFSTEEYEFECQKSGLILSKKGTVRSCGEPIPIYVKKEIRPGKDSIRIRYSLENLSQGVISFVFGLEWNFCLFPGEMEIRKQEVVLLKGRLVFQAVPFDGIWHFPLQTLSQSEKGYDIIHQGICLIPHWKISLSGQEKFSMEIRLKE
ncbi:MAG: alpha-amylase/4-alpha-glucanotransferase domain-containing protein [Candidatus Aminicenantales bacterium]